MELAVLTTSVSRNAGGLFESVRNLHGSISESVSTRVFGLWDEYSEQDLKVWGNLDIELFFHLGPRSLSYSLPMYQALERSNPDIVHVHGLWQGPSIASSKYSSRRDRPYMISPRGMLDPWALQNFRWKKIIIGRLFENNHLKTAACLHALCESETQSMRSYGLKNPVCVIPNGVTLPKMDEIEKSSCSERKIMLFLGRIHPKKGLLNALQAWKVATKSKMHSEWRLVIAGWDQQGHEAELKALCEEIGLAYTDMPAANFNSDTIKSDQCSVFFVGPVFGREKNRMLSNADVFLLPSFSEGLPMTVLEAWSHSLPVLMTSQCNLPIGATVGAALEVNSSTESIIKGLIECFNLTTSDRVGMGQRGRNLVEKSFTWEQAAGQMKEVYDWVLGGGSPPSCIVHRGR